MKQKKKQKKKKKKKKKGGQITRLKHFSVLQEGNGDDRSVPKELGHFGCCKDVSM
ncbi:hypothetical protein M0802_016437 [Mischocyttarus mexicanus]|nr:hypothetical protein M0802_016437 [Mischocyttarus mexicanus]